MSRNIEIKARITKWGELVSKATAIADHDPVEITQDNTFFRCENGRLKLRQRSATEGELIFYRRADQQGPRPSFYLVCPTTHPAVLLQSLSLAYGIVGRVQKRRILFLAGRTRIHLDNVIHLGQFLELEVVLQDDEPLDSGMDEARKIMAELGIDPSELVEQAYVDLLFDKNGRPLAHNGPGQSDPSGHPMACTPNAWAPAQFK